MRDRDKLIVIAQTFSYLRGSFTAHQLYDFIQGCDYKFHSDFSARQIGRQLSKSKKFITIRERPTKYEVI